MRLYFISRQAFHEWLGLNQCEETPVWIEFYKDGTEGISYNEALEEALCFGWIDSLIKKVDERVYLRKFCKRRPGSKWSAVNKAKVQELTTRGLMMPAGLAAVHTAHQTGAWDRPDERETLTDVDGLRLALGAADLAIFDTLSESLRKHYALVWGAAKTEPTRVKRLALIREYMKSKKRVM